eukprot:gene38381-50385_t
MAAPPKVSKSVTRASYFFEDVFTGFELGGLTREHHQIRDGLRDLSFFSSTRSYTLAELYRRAVEFTHMGLMNFRFRCTVTEADWHVLVRLPHEFPFPEDSPITNLGKIPWDGDDEDGAPGAMDVEDGQDWDSDGGDYETPSKGPGPGPEPGASLPAHISLATQVPLMRPVGSVMALSSRAKGTRPNCFNFYSLDNHSDISIFCNAGLHSNICEFKSGLKVSGISDTSVNFTHIESVQSYRYEGVIRENGHHYVVDKENLFYAIMDKDNRMLVKFDYDPSDHFYKVKVDHAFDFMDPNLKAVTVMYFSSEQRRCAALVPPIHIALNHLSDEALVEALNSPSLMNCPISAEDIANARIIYGQCKDCMEGKPLPIKGSNSTLDKMDIIAPGQLLHVDIVFISKIPHLFCVDDFCNYMNLIRMASKRKEALEHALLALVLFYRSHLKVVRCISSDHEASCESFLQLHGATYR